MNKEQYVNKILKIANSNIPKKHVILTNILNKYYEFCYKNKLDAMFPEFYHLFNSSYIIESKPLIFEVPEEDVKKAVMHLKEVQDNLKNNIPDGISLEEAKLLLDWDVQNARKILRELEPDLENSSLDGCCGYGQALTLLPFQELGLETTVNNASQFPMARYRHAFGTVTLPIKEDNNCYQKRYLLDVTYRQFFSSILCAYGRYYCNNMDSAPSAGYYICQTEKGISFATELLKNGYIELDFGNIYYYGYGFESEAITPYTRDNKALVDTHTEEYYFNAIKNSSEEIDFTEEEIEKLRPKLTFPNENFTR